MFVAIEGVSFKPSFDSHKLNRVCVTPRSTQCIQSMQQEFSKSKYVILAKGDAFYSVDLYTMH